MVVFWLATAISIILCLVISFQIKQFGVGEAFKLIMFFFSSTSVILEILKWPLGKRKIDNSKGLARFVFGDSEGSFSEHHLIYRESIFNAKKGKEAFIVWSSFIFSLFFLGFSLYLLFFD